jgi:hypothetical protein
MNQAKFKKEDWIVLRLLFTILAADPSAGNLPDVYKTKRYYEDRFGLEEMLIAFAAFNREASNNGTFGNPDVRLTRGVHITWKHAHEHEDITHPTKAMLDMEKPDGSNA